MKNKNYFSGFNFLINFWKLYRLSKYLEQYPKSLGLSMRYFQFHNVQNLKMILKIRCYILNCKSFDFFVRIIQLSEEVTYLC